VLRRGEAVEEVATRFLDKFTTAMAGLKTGDSMDEATTLVPLSSNEALLKRVASRVDTGMVFINHPDLDGCRSFRSGASSIPGTAPERSSLGIQEFVNKKLVSVAGIHAPALLRKTWVGGLLFLGFYTVFLLGLKWSAPGYVEEVWNLPALSGVLWYGLPLEEFLFGLSFGLYWAAVYEHFAWLRVTEGPTVSLSTR
jgi:hypothetical protein